MENNELNAIIQQGKKDILARNQQAPCPISQRWEWVNRYEEAELPKNEIMELILISRETKNKKEQIKALEQLKNLYLDNGNLEKAKTTATLLIRLNPENSTYHRSLGLILEESGDEDAARKTYLNAYEQTGKKEFLSLSRDIGRKESIETQIPDPEKIGYPDTIGDAFKFLDLFSGREGVYARQWSSPTGDTGYTPVHEALTPNLILQHIDGRQTLGIYQIRLDNTVSFICFDIDMDKNIATESMRNQTLYDNTMSKCKSAGIRILDKLASHHINGTLEESGYKGYHIWIFLDTPMKANAAKTFGTMISETVTLPENIHLEIFPKQSFVRENGLGNLIKLPLGIHLKTGKRSKFLNPDFTEPENQRETLHRIAKTPKSIVITAISQLEAEKATSRPQATTFTGEPHTAQTGFPPAEEYIPEKNQELQQLLSGCPILKTIYRKAMGSQTLTEGERLTITHTIGHIRDGVRAVNHIFSKAGVESQFFLKSPLKGNAVSCSKIKKRLKTLTETVNCDCKFPDRGHLYPSPILHIGSQTNSELPPSLDSTNTEQLFNNYIKLKRDIAKSRQLLIKLENELSKIFEEAGIDTIMLPQGKLKREQNEEGQTIFSITFQ